MKQSWLQHVDGYEETVADIRQSFKDEEAGRVRTLSEVDELLRQKYGFTRRS